MTKNKKVVSRMMFILLVLTLVSFCFVGFTFARYTSTGTGSAAVHVAKWSVNLTNAVTPVEGETVATFANLSPSKDEYKGTTRTNSTGIVKVATITNNGEVDALVTLDFGEIALTTIASPATGFSADNAKKPFSIKFYKEDKTTEITAGTELTVAAGAAQDIYAVVTWTSDGLEGITDADANDTMIGQNVTAVSWTISYTAVQNSQTSPAA